MPEHYSAPDPLDEILAVRGAPDNATLSDLGLECCVLLATCPYHGLIEFGWCGGAGENPPQSIRCDERNKLWTGSACGYACAVTGKRTNSGGM